MKVGFSYIGTPDGFEHSSFGIAKSIRMSWKVDLDNRLINIHPNTEILMIKREIEENNLFTYIVLYRFAYEITNTRLGSFYGSALVLKNQIPNGNPGIIEFLTCLANELKNGIDENNRFISPIRDLKPQLDYSSCEKDFDHLLVDQSEPVRELNAKCFFKPDENTDNYETVLKNIFKSRLFNRFGVIFTSYDEQVFMEAVNHELPIETIASLTEAVNEEEVKEAAFAVSPYITKPDIPLDVAMQAVQTRWESAPQNRVPREDFEVHVSGDDISEDEDESFEDKEKANQSANGATGQDLWESIKNDAREKESANDYPRSLEVVSEHIKKPKLLIALAAFGLILVLGLLSYLIFSRIKNPTGANNESYVSGTIYYTGHMKSPYASRSKLNCEGQEDCVFKKPSDLANFLAQKCTSNSDSSLQEKNELTAVIKQQNDLVEDYDFPIDKAIKVPLPRDYKCSKEILNRGDIVDKEPVEEPSVNKNPTTSTVSHNNSKKTAEDSPDIPIAKKETPKPVGGTIKDNSNINKNVEKPSTNNQGTSTGNSPNNPDADQKPETKPPSSTNPENVNKNKEDKKDSKSNDKEQMRRNPKTSNPRVRLDAKGNISNEQKR